MALGEHQGYAYILEGDQTVPSNYRSVTLASIHANTIESY